MGAIALGLTWTAPILPHSYPSSSSSSLSRFSAFSHIKYSPNRALNRSKGIAEHDFYGLPKESYDDEWEARQSERTQELDSLGQQEDEGEEEDGEDEEEDGEEEEEKDYSSSDEEESEPENPLDRLSVPKCFKDEIDVERYGFRTLLDDFDYFPSKISVRSSINKFYKFKRVLKQLKLHKQFKESLFGQFYHLSNHWQFNGQLVHSLLLRKIKDKKLHEIWFLVDGKPVCFGLKEFFLMTGLNCQSKPSASKTVKVLAKGEAFWRKVTKNGAKVSSDEIMKMLQSKNRFSKEEKLKLSLLWFLHTILMARDASKSVDNDWIMMVDDLNFFSKYPWGKECFDITLDYLKNRLKMADYQRSYIEKGKTSGYALFGFPWAFQAWIYEAFPAIGRKARKTNVSPLPIPRMLKWHHTKMSSSFNPLQRQRLAIKVVHPYLIPTVHEMEKGCLQFVVPYSYEVADEAIDALKAELEGVTAIKTRSKVLANDDDVEEDFDDGRGGVQYFYSVDADIGATDGRVGNGPSEVAGTCIHCGASKTGPSMKEVLAKLAAVEDQFAKVVKALKNANEVMSKHNLDVHAITDTVTFPDVHDNGKLTASTIGPKVEERMTDVDDQMEVAEETSQPEARKLSEVAEVEEGTNEVNDNSAIVDEAPEPDAGQMSEAVEMGEQREEPNAEDDVNLNVVSNVLRNLDM